MIKISVTQTISRDIDRITSELKQLPEDATRFFRAHTPIRSGNARRKTRREGDTIVADYPYAQRLEDGASKQAPDGMVKPTEAYIQRRLNEITRKR